MANPNKISQRRHLPLSTPAATASPRARTPAPRPQRATASSACAAAPARGLLLRPRRAPCGRVLPSCHAPCGRLLPSRRGTRDRFRLSHARALPPPWHSPPSAPRPSTPCLFASASPWPQEQRVIIDSTLHRPKSIASRPKSCQLPQEEKICCHKRGEKEILQREVI
jgi:hypothetical protein